MDEPAHIPLQREGKSVGSRVGRRQHQENALYPWDALGCFRMF